jgi:hypothetical protein
LENWWAVPERLELSEVKETDITFSWSATLTMLGGALVMIALGVSLTHTEGIVVVVGYLFAGGGVMVLLIMPFRAWGTSASCPLCGTRVVMVGYNPSCVRCTKCDEYLEGRSKKARQMDTQYVSEAPAFQVPLPWRDLGSATSPTVAFDAQEYLRDKILTKKGPERLVPAVWPSGCCVCGGAVKYERAIAQVLKRRSDKVMAVRDIEVKIICQNIPYCDAHKDGVSIDRSDGLDWCLKFRSYAYRNEFRRLNRWGKDALSV